MGIRLTNRDIQIIEFLKEFRVVSTSDLMELFNFNQSSVNRRMKQLMEEFKDIKKIDYNPTYNFYNDKYECKLKNENVYYWKRKSKSIEHDLLINKVYMELLNRKDFVIKEFKREYRITLDDFTVIVDGYILIEYRDREYEYLLELENNKNWNYKKYYKLEQEGIILPPLVICTNRRIVNYCKNLEIIKIKLNLSDIDKWLKDFKLRTRDVGYKVNY
jgi:hypothetical protein